MKVLPYKPDILPQVVAAYNDAFEGVPHCYPVSPQAFAQALLDVATEHLRGCRANRIDAYHYEHRYPFYYVEHAYLSSRLDHVQALLGINGYQPLDCEVVLDWPDYAVSPAAEPPVPATISLEWTPGQGCRPGLIVRAHQAQKEVGICVCVSCGDYAEADDAQDWLYTPWIGPTPGGASSTRREWNMSQAKRKAENRAAQPAKQNAGFPGPIRVSPNGRYFVDAQGQPFFWLGDTAWPLFAQYAPEDAEAYLEDRSRKGFTVIQGVLAWGGGTGFEGHTPGPNYAGHRPWLDGPDKPNEAYFQHVDRLLGFAAERGLILAMLPTWGYYVSDVKTFNVDNARAYGRWLGARYKDQPNIVWVNGGDRIPTRCEDVYRALAHGLREGDGRAHPITYHPCGWRSSAQFFHQEDWLDFNMIETWTEWAKVYPAILSDSLLLPTKPVVLGEGAYENGPEYPQGPITPLIVRRQAWWAFMAGGFFTYGQDRMWRMGPGWTNTFDTPGAQHMAQFRAIASSRPWWKRVPDQGLFASGVSCERTLNAAVRSVDSDWAMIYLSSQCHVLLHLDKILTRRVQVTWVDPRNGEERDGGTYATGNLVEGTFPQPKSQWFSTPGHWEDAVLILDGVN